jgi:hypothetical protein
MLTEAMSKPEPAYAHLAELYQRLVSQKFETAKCYFSSLPIISPNSPVISG